MYQCPDYLMHYGVFGMKWGRRRAQKKSTKHIKKVANEAYSRNKKISDAYSAVRGTSEYTRHQGNVKSSHDKWSKAFNESEKSFDEFELKKAIEEYSKRDRRFGNIEDKK